MLRSPSKSTAPFTLMLPLPPPPTLVMAIAPPPLWLIAPSVSGAPVLVKLIAPLPALDALKVPTVLPAWLRSMPVPALALSDPAVIVPAIVWLMPPMVDRLTDMPGALMASSTSICALADMLSEPPLASVVAPSFTPPSVFSCVTRVLLKANEALVLVLALSVKVTLPLSSELPATTVRSMVLKSSAPACTRL